jgi:predicted ATPase/class 3 adenylate cyclase
MESAASNAAAAVHHGLPSGNIAFLFTDIEGSTVRWERDTAAMTQAVRRHDQIMRAAIQAHNGHVFKTIGDAFCAVFWNIQDGLSATLDAQRALAAEDFSAVDGIRVRMALHVGVSDERDGDYFGPTLNRVARLLAIGHGGQVLLSSAAAGQLAPAMPQDVALRDLGEHRLKDLTAPERVSQLFVPDLPADFPKLKSLSVLDNNLPLQLTSLVGRDADIVEIKALLGTGRLVTLIGSGGVGKTRCGLQVAAEMLDGFADGVWFVDLAPLSNPSLVPNVIASIFDVQEQPDQTMLASLITHLKNKQLMLLIDNCEHLIHEASKTVEALLRDCPKVSILATSREILGIGGEAVYRMPSLSIPDATKGLAAEQAMSFGSVALFVARAHAANAKFELTDDIAPTVGEICRRLDGIPLALELAAARVRVLSVSSLAQRLDERFKILTGGSRTALPRQQTMRALIDWSYDLLSEREQTIFRFFSIFSGAFTFDFAMTVCTGDKIEDIEILDLLTSLADKSLLNTDHSSDDVRYRMLESTKQYAHEKLVEHGEYEAIVRRHAETYLAFADGLDREWDTTADIVWIACAEAEIDNLRAALDWALGLRGEVEIGQGLAATRIWEELARAEGRRYLRTALELVTPQTPRALFGRLEVAASKIDSSFGQFKSALASAERAIQTFQELGDERGLAEARLCAGRALLFSARISEGEEMLQSALGCFRSVNDRKATATALASLGYARALQDDMPGARSLLKEAAALYEAGGAVARLPAVISLLAEAEFRAGDAQAAIEAASRGLTAARSVNSRRNLANLLPNMAAYLTSLGRYDEAEPYAREALGLAREEQAETNIAFTLQHLAAIVALRGGQAADDQVRAARLLGFVDARLIALDAAREYTEQREYDAALEALRSALGAPQLEGLMGEGSLWDEERAVAEALQR